MQVAKRCPKCQTHMYMTLNNEESEHFHQWSQRKMLIQDAFPAFNPMEREFLMTGYCPNCQREIFGTNYTSDRIRDHWWDD